MSRQLIIGVVFGLIAIFGTEFGINVDGATINVRDAAPLAAGLLFSGPAGILAGIIGAVERWFAAGWGRGIFTRVACSVATLAAGIYAALLRKQLFDGKKPTWSMGVFIAVVVEVLHLMLIFLTNMDMAQRAFAVVRACSIPMIALNAISVMLSVIVVTKLSGENLRKPPEKREISESMQSGMLIAVIVAFLFTSGFTYIFQTGISEDQLLNLCILNVKDVEEDLNDAANNRMLSTASTLASNLKSVEEAKAASLSEVAEQYHVTEVNVVDESGFVVASNRPKMVGYDMARASQSKVFLDLLGERQLMTQEYDVTSPASESDEEGLLRYMGAKLTGGFVQVGFNQEDRNLILVAVCHGFTKNRHVGEEGSILIVDDENMVLSAYDVNSLLTDLSETGLDKALEENEPGYLFSGRYVDEDVYGVYREYENLRIIAIQPKMEAKFSRNVAVLLSAFMEVLVFAALFAVIYILIKRLVVDNVHSVNGTLGLITAGDLDVTVDVRSNKEFASLSHDINKTVAALKRAIDAAAKRLDTELEYARTIQRSALPQVFPPYPNRHDFDLFANMSAAKEVGGDFYDFYLLDDDHLLFLIADVSGKGIPAAMFMMSAKTTIKSLAESGLPIDQVFIRANEELCEGNEAEMFVTCWMGVLDLRTGDLQFCNAGHNPPALSRNGAPFEYYVTRPNMVLAGMEGIRYRIQEFKLEPGDTLFLYTDGVTEATNANDQLFGEDRLLEVLDEIHEEDVGALCTDVHARVDEFVGDAPQFDDITVLAVRYYGEKAGEQHE
ncbi:MAG: SpoIIE family protein phosphatase [Coriobacteriales bacterium]|nr:SpoIIE family protein phosphatase [Coriobacteriales bacterium]